MLYVYARTEGDITIWHMDIARQYRQYWSHYFTSRARVTAQLLTVGDVIIHRYETQKSRLNVICNGISDILLCWFSRIGISCR